MTSKSYGNKLWQINSQAKTHMFPMKMSSAIPIPMEGTIWRGRGSPLLPYIIPSKYDSHFLLFPLAFTILLIHVHNLFAVKNSFTQVKENLGDCTT